MIKVPVSVQSWAHHLQVVHDVQRELLLWWLLLTGLVRIRLWRWCEQEAVKATVTTQDDVADLHLAGQRLQIVPDLLGLAIEVHVSVNLLLTLQILNVLLLDLLPL